VMEDGGRLMDEAWRFQVPGSVRQKGSLAPQSSCQVPTQTRPGRDGTHFGGVWGMARGQRPGWGWSSKQPSPTATGPQSGA
jgi:hypothetical protein